MKLKNFYIGSYRGLENVELNEFADTNIFVGKNNSGKTSFLEAIILSGLFDDAELLIQTVVSRYQQISVELMKDMFKLGEESVICLKRQMKETEDRVHTHITYDDSAELIQENGIMTECKRFDLKFQYNLENRNEKENKNSIYKISFFQKGNAVKMDLAKGKSNQGEMRIPCEFISFSRFDRTNYLINSLDEVLEQDKRQELIHVLQIFDSSVKNFEVIGAERDIRIFREGEEKPLSLYDYGNGMYKAFYIASAALLCEDGMLLIDEIEAGIHKEALHKFVWYLLELGKRKNIQLFITTHSLETLDLFLEHRQDELNTLAIYNLRQKEEETIVRRYSGESLYDLRQDMGLDVR